MQSGVVARPRLGKYLRVGAAQVVRVERGCVVEVVLPDAAKRERQRILGRRLGNQARMQSDERLDNYRLAPDHNVGLRCIRIHHGEQFIAREQRFAQAVSININAT